VYNGVSILSVVLLVVFAGFFKMLTFLRQVLLLLCLITVVLPVLATLPIATVNLSHSTRVWAQVSPLSPLTESAPAVSSPALSPGSQTSLVLVAIVLVGVLAVVGLVLWRQR
jgi:hypothetical protein